MPNADTEFLEFSRRNRESMKVNKDKVLNILRDGKDLTQAEATSRLGIPQLASVINNLRQDGVRIRTTMVEVKKGTYRASYSLDDGSRIDEPDHESHAPADLAGVLAVSRAVGSGRQAGGSGAASAKYTADGLRVEILMVTPGMARNLRDACHYERQRDLSDQHIRFLTTEQEKGRFLRGTMIHMCVLKGRPFIVNGNHTLEMISRSGISMPLTFLYQRVENEEEIGRIYARHDSHRARDWTAKLRATGQEDALGVSGQWLRSASAAAPFIARDLKAMRESGEDYHLSRSSDSRFDVLGEWGDEINQYVTLCFGAPKHSIKIMRRAALIACGTYVLRYQPATASEFINGMAMDDRLSNTDPRKRLLLWCLENSASGWAALPAHERRFRSAWNAYFEGRSLSALYEAKPETPLKGTPIGASVLASAKEPIMKTGVSYNSDGKTVPVMSVEI